MNLPNLSNVTSLSAFKLIQTNDVNIVGLNKGYNGELDKGFFHFIGFDPINDNYLISKPVQEINEHRLKCFIISKEEFNKHCTVLLSFYLNNN